MDLTVRIGQRELPNPVGVSSGTFGYGNEYSGLVDLGKLGALFTKAITLEPTSGNPPPRLVETPSGILNSIGLANVGVNAFLTEKMPYLRTLKCAVIANVAGFTENEYLQVVEKLEPESLLWGYEINLSCPNVRHGCLAFGTDPERIESLIGKLRRITEKPLIVKLTPNVADIKPIAQSAENGGADALSCINTLTGMVVDTNLKKPVLARGTGGLSGPAIRPVGVAMTFRAGQAVRIPVIGIGGITSPEDALQYFLAGASAVQVGTANFVDPSTPIKVLDGIEAFCIREKLSRITDIHRWKKLWE